MLNVIALPVGILVFSVYVASFVMGMMGSQMNGDRVCRRRASVFDMPLKWFFPTYPAGVWFGYWLFGRRDVVCRDVFGSRIPCRFCGPDVKKKRHFFDYVPEETADANTPPTGNP